MDEDESGRVGWRTGEERARKERRRWSFVGGINEISKWGRNQAPRCQAGATGCFEEWSRVCYHVISNWHATARFMSILD